MNPLDMEAAAAYLGITPNTLRAYRFKRYPPGHRHAFPEPAMRVGNGRVPLWTADQLDAWQELRADTLKHGKRSSSIASRSNRPTERRAWAAPQTSTGTTGPTCRSSTSSA